MKYRDFWVSKAAILNFSQFTKKFQNLDIWSLLTFLLCQMVRIVFQYDMCRKEESMFD